VHSNEREKLSQSFYKVTQLNKPCQVGNLLNKRLAS